MPRQAHRARIPDDRASLLPWRAPLPDRRRDAHRLCDCGAPRSSVELLAFRRFRSAVGLALYHRQQLRTDLGFDVARDFRMLLQEHAGIFLALANALALVAVPGAGLLDDVLRAAHVDDLAFARDALPVHDLEFGFAERRGNLVLDHFDAGLVADDLFAILDGADATDVETHRGIELQRVTTGGGFGVAEHHADLHADLVDEDDDGVGTLDVAR